LQLFKNYSDMILQLISMRLVLGEAIPVTTAQSCITQHVQES
jgi:hypothetical protein